MVNGIDMVRDRSEFFLPGLELGQSSGTEEIGVLGKESLFF